MNAIHLAEAARIFGRQPPALPGVFLGGDDCPSTAPRQSRGLTALAISGHPQLPRAVRAERGGQRGFTLLEIILALAILAGAMAALGEVMRLADQNATMTEGETQAQILAASLLDEFVSGSRELAPVEQQSLVEESDPPWVYSVAIENTSLSELVAVRVRVEQKMDARLQPAHFELVRWMANPNSFTSESTDETGSSSGTGSTSSSASGGSSSSSTSSNSGGTR